MGLTHHYELERCIWNYNGAAHIIRTPFSAHGACLLGNFWSLLVMERPSWTHYTHGWLLGTFGEGPPLFVGPVDHLFN